MIKGVVVIAPPTEDKRIDYLKSNNIPAVIVGSKNSSETFATIDVDDGASVCFAVEEFVNAGHRKIGIITGPQYMSSAINRESAFLSEMARNGMSVKGEYVRCGSYTREGGKLAALELLKLDDRPTALFASNDDMALGVYDAADELGLSVPDDISVIGFDDIAEASEVSPQLTTIQQPYTEFASFTAKVFAENDFKQSAEVVATYIGRQSVKCINVVGL